MMEHWGYRFEDMEGLNYGKGHKILLENFELHDKNDHRGLGYSSTPDKSDVDSNPLARYDHSSNTSSFNSDVSVGTLFEPVSVNMVSAQPEPDDDKIELIDTKNDPWIKHLNMLWTSASNNESHPQIMPCSKFIWATRPTRSPYISVTPSLKTRRWI